MNKIIISIFILLWVAVGAMAQTATVTGMVTDDMGPVIGATVTVQGTSIGATTDLDGKFTLTSVPNVAKAVLIVRYVGMEEAKEPLKEEYLSQSGDIIVRLTAPYTAVLIDETTSGMVVSSNFVVIRVEDKNLLPEYLFWLLNTEKIKRKIYENATSNMLGAVNARFLADFDLTLLSVENQHKISQFNLLAKRECQLLMISAY